MTLPSSHRDTAKLQPDKACEVLQPLPRPPSRHMRHAAPGPGALPARLLLLHVGSTHGAPLRPADLGRRQILCQLSAFGALPSQLHCRPGRGVQGPEVLTGILTGLAAPTTCKHYCSPCRLAAPGPAELLWAWLRASGSLLQHDASFVPLDQNHALGTAGQEARTRAVQLHQKHASWGESLIMPIPVDTGMPPLCLSAA